MNKLRVEYTNGLVDYFYTPHNSLQSVRLPDKGVGRSERVASMLITPVKPGTMYRKADVIA